MRQMGMYSSCSKLSIIVRRESIFKYNTLMVPIIFLRTEIESITAEKR